MTKALAVYQAASYRTLLRRRGLLVELERTLRQLEREYARDVESIRQFERRYRPAVGDHYDELERIRSRITRGWDALQKARCELPEGGSPHDAPPEESRDAATRPGAEARQVFLALVRLIHPDLTSDEQDRRRRHEMMAEATLAYRNDDARRLQWLLEHWRADSEPIRGFGLGASWSRTNRRLAWVRYRIRETQYALGQLHSSPVARIMEEHERRRAVGRNLILEMRRQTSAELEEAQRELERLDAAVRDLEEDLQEKVRAAMSD